MCLSTDHDRSLLTNLAHQEMMILVTKKTTYFRITKFSSETWRLYSSSLKVVVKFVKMNLKWACYHYLENDFRRVVTDLTQSLYESRKSHDRRYTTLKIYVGKMSDRRIQHILSFPYRIFTFISSFIKSSAPHPFMTVCLFDGV